MMPHGDRNHSVVRIDDTTGDIVGRPGSHLSPEARQREGRTIRLALTLLGHGRAEAFLNQHHPELYGRPISIAADSPDGAAAVERLIMLARETDGRFVRSEGRVP